MYNITDEYLINLTVSEAKYWAKRYGMDKLFEMHLNAIKSQNKLENYEIIHYIETPMRVDESKLARQNDIIRRWWGVNARGVYTGVTGFGKTYVILMIIDRMIRRFPTYRSTIIVPSQSLKEAWEKSIADMHLTNVTVYIVNTYVKFKEGDPRLDTDFLAGDEAHHYASEEALFFNQVLPITTYKYCIFASATLEHDEIAFLQRHGIQLFDEVNTEEAEANGWIARSIVYNLGLTFTSEDKEVSAKLDNTFKANFARFDHKFDLMMACMGGSVKRFRVIVNGTPYYKTGQDWRVWWATNMGWNHELGDEHAWSPKKLIIAAKLGTKAMKERKELLYNMPSKIDVVLQLLDRFPNKKVIVFCETQSAADELERLRPEVIKSYHSNLGTIIIDGKKFGTARRRKLIIKQFEENDCRVIACVKALDEGFNVESIDMAIMHSYVSKKRRDVQRKGRSSRIDYDNLDKLSLVVNLYMMDSQELKWLNAKQKKSRKPIWVESLDNINL